MENLTKQQIVLVTLLVSFVTSIATGIFTVSLMEGAPPTITQTVNRVVERTIEKVVPNENLASVIEKETIVVRSDDMVVSAVEKNMKSLVRIKKSGVDTNEQKNAILGLGLVVSKDGIIVADSSIISKQDEVLFAVFFDEKVLPISFFKKDSENNLIYLKPSEKDINSLKISFYPVAFGDANSLKLGQTVISLGGGDEENITTGIVSGLNRKNVASTETTATTTLKDENISKIVSLIKTNIISLDSVSGATLLNLSGEVVGFRAGDSLYSRNNYIPINTISTFLSKI